MMHYFEDMYYVLKEMYRVLTPNSKSFILYWEILHHMEYMFQQLGF